METQGLLAITSEAEPMSAATGRRFLRAGLLLALAGLVLGVVGDHRGVTAAVSRGIDPLEILNLLVKPNVIVVLDSSGSMSNNLTSGDITGDYARSKMSLAKDVLNQVVTDNADDVNFLFGQYNQGTTSMANTGPGSDRFYYVATSYEYPNMISLELSLRREPGTESSFNVSAGVNDTITFFERVSTSASSRTYVVCSFVIPAGSYVADTDMTNLAATIQTRLTQPYPNANVTCTKYGSSANNAGNSYAFTWDTANQRFRIGRSGGSNYYQLRFGTGTASAGPALGFSSNLPNTTTPVPPAGGTSTNFANSNWSNVNSGTPYNGTTLGLIGVSSRGFEAWRDIRSAWNTFYFREGVQNCSFTIDTPPSPPGIYVRGADLALQIQDKMNGVAPNPNPCGSLSPRNTYAVAHDGPNGVFYFTRIAGTSDAILQWRSQTTYAARAALNARWNPPDLYSGSANAAGLGYPGGNPGTDFWDIRLPFDRTGDVCPVAAPANSFCTQQVPLLRRFTGNDPGTAAVAGGAPFKFTENYDPDGAAGPQLAQNITTYYLRAGKLFNGEIFQVTGSGGLCSMRTGPTQVPPVVTLEQVDTCGGSVENTVVFKWAGAEFGGGACGGFAARVPLATCDQAGSIQLSAIQPFLAKQNIFNPDGTIIGYEEDTSAGFAGGFRVRSGASYNATNVGGSTLTGGIRATGYTPIANSLRDIKTKFVDLWNNGQTPITPISAHDDPKERTIVIFVTDGDDTCPEYDGGGDTSNMDDSALRAAYKAQLLYQRIDALEPASSVTTYVVGFGLSSSRLNWIAWGGSGMTWATSNSPDSSPSYLEQWAASNPGPTGPTQAQKDAQCPTCIDAYAAPTPEKLSEVIQSIINQGAQFGDFTAQASLVEPVYEYSAEVPTAGPAYSPFMGAGSKSRYEGLVPVLFWSTFSMPDFQGHFYGITAAAGVAVTRWDAGERLKTLAQTGMTSCNDGSAGQGTFDKLADSTNNCAIDRRIYTTSRNGVFPVTISNLTDLPWLQSDGNRTSLWPPSSTVNPANPLTVGLLDAALGLPMANDLAAWDDLTTTFQACLGAGAPSACSGPDSQRVPQARKEAREMILAYMAGAKVVLDVNTAEPLRKGSGPNPNPNPDAILYQARSWILAESTMATSAVVAPPMQSTPTGVYDPEYVNYRDGPRTTTSTPAPTDGLKLGFGLRNPDLVGGTDVTNTLNPVMTVTYVAANDMLHAFRAGPNTSACTPPPTTVDCGGEELWGFVPYDQLAKLRDLMLPQTRTDHAFVMAAPVRFSDVFVPAPGTTSNPSGATFSVTVQGADVTGKGVWRKLVIVGRGIAGKHLTALDVTAPGPFTGLAKDAIGPIPYWSRGNPDTVDGLSGGGLNNDAADRDAYAKMGETWSVPAIGYVDRLHSARKGCGSTPGVPCTNPTGGVEFVAFAGSGYGDASSCSPPSPPAPPCEGTTFYTLDLLTGDVVASADVGQRSPLPAGGYDNALVANPAAYASNQFNYKAAGHPFNASHKTSRVYIGDLHGRLWKFVTSALSVPVLFADLGVDQPVGTAVALLKLPADDTGKPYVFANTGNDSRARGVQSWEAPTTGQFRYFAFRDDASDGDTTPPATAQSCTPTVQLPCIWTDELKGTPQFGGDFRGTVQPATVMAQDTLGNILGRVFFAGTRFVPPVGSLLSTPVPPYPCRSRFDSIAFALGAETGGAGFDLNEGGVDDRYIVLDNAKIVAVSIIVDPVGGGSRPHLDDGLRKPNITPTPPEMGPRPVLGSSVTVPAGTTITGSTVCK